MGQNGPKRGQNEVYSHFIVLNAIVFAHIVYFDRKLWYLAANAGDSAEKSFLGPIMGQLGPKRGQNDVLSFFSFKMDHFLLFMNVMIEHCNM